MQRPGALTVLESFNSRIKATERLINRRSNMLPFLVVRFVLMSGMAVGFKIGRAHV